MTPISADNRIELALAQINVTVGDLVGNADMIIANIAAARESGAQIVLFPELAISGYPPEDLVLREDFLSSCRAQLERVAASAQGMVALVGLPMASSAGVANALAVLADGEVVTSYEKRLLPNHGVFDERRYFTAGSSEVLIDADGLSLGLSVCEDVWFDEPVCSRLAARGARMILNASASPFHFGKAREREQMLAERANRFDLPIAYCNLVGGQDELVFDGASVVVGSDGAILARAPQFEDALLRCSVPLIDPPLRRDPQNVRVSLGAGSIQSDPAAQLPVSREQEVYSALVLAVRDYVAKNGFKGVLVGVSGGIDSALVLALACDALGPEAVTAVTMPSPFNSPQTRGDGRELIDRIGCKSHEFAIDPMMAAFEAALKPVFEGMPVDATEENIQARIRGILLMALSNKFGSLVLTTGNKSEMAVGYATLYGDMAGGFAPLKDVPKQLVFSLCSWRNEKPDSPIPVGIIERPPSAELRPDQADEDTLGSYAVLDAVIEQYIERDRSLDEIVADGVDRDFAERILGMIDRAEYKRRQAPPGVKITERAFGRDRRMPITARRRYR